MLTRSGFIRAFLLGAYLLLMCLIIPNRSNNVARFNWVVAGTAHADDIDDVETDVDAVMSDSDAAQSEAADAKARAKKEHRKELKLKRQANHQEAVALAKEKSAKKQIRQYDRKTLKSKMSELKYQKAIDAAKKKIADLDSRLAARKLQYEKAESDAAAAKSEKISVENDLAKKLKEKASLETSIQQDKSDTAHLVRDLADLKKQQRVLEKNLVELRKAALRQAEAKARAKIARNEMKRQVSSIPTKVLVRAPKMNCDVTAQAAIGARKIGEIRAGKRYALYRLIKGQWVELQLGTLRGFAARGCF